MSTSNVRPHPLVRTLFVPVSINRYNSTIHIAGDFTMSKANVDPAELRRFAMDLKRFTDEITALVGTMNGRMNNLGESWRDQEHKKFAEAFAQTTKTLGTFVQAAGEHAAFLNKKATAVEQYLRQR